MQDTSRIHWHHPPKTVYETQHVMRKDEDESSTTVKKTQELAFVAGRYEDGVPIKNNVDTKS